MQLGALQLSLLFDPYLTVFKVKISSKLINKVVLYQEQIRFSHLNFLKIAQLTMRYESIPHRGRIAYLDVKVYWS